MTRPADEAKNGVLCALLVSLAMALPSALVLFACNTPLGPSIGSDNAMYLTMGTALARGYAPYTEIFDHKGPLLFLLEMIPQCFAGGYQTGTVFLMEVLFLTGCLFAVDRICALLDIKRGRWIVQLAYLALFSPCVDGGNLSEEYANLFTLVGLILMLCTFGGVADTRRKHLFFPAMGMGALTMLAFLTRANNALPLLGVVGGLSVGLIVRQEWKSLGLCALGFLSGCAAALLPIALWLWHFDALDAAFYGSIVHNMMYAETEGASRVAMLFGSGYGGLAMGMAALTALGAAACFARTRQKEVPLAMLAGALGAGAAAFISHKFYMHYLTLGVPTAALGIAQMLALAQRYDKKRITLGMTALVSGAALCLCCAQANARRIADRVGMDAFIEDAQALYAQVSQEDQDSFMAYRVEPKWYVAAEALPCMRFYFLQEILGQADPRVMDEVALRFETDPPKWLVLFYNRPFSPPYDARVQKVFDERYVFVDARGEYQLLRLDEEGADEPTGRALCIN